MKKVAIYGTGKVAEYFLERHDFDNEKLECFVETEKSKDSFHDYPVIGIGQIDKEIDVLYFANSYVDTVFCALERGIPKERIVICNEALQNKYVLKNAGVLDLVYEKSFADEYEKHILKVENYPKYVLMRTMNNPIELFNCKNIKTIFGNRIIVSNDYCRYGTLRLLIEEIINRNVIGEIAELGVYQGEFAKFLNEMFPTRNLYLFDTFEGFDKKDVDAEMEENYTPQDWFDGWDYFRNTNVDMVMEKMKYPKQCIVRRGYFPDTIPDIDLSYAFVSLDCDLYEPILAGLRYFYPRLSSGGYIMIHDYNQYH